MPSKNIHNLFKQIKTERRIIYIQIRQTFKYFSQCTLIVAFKRNGLQINPNATLKKRLPPLPQLSETFVSCPTVKCTYVNEIITKYQISYIISTVLNKELHLKMYIDQTFLSHRTQGVFPSIPSLSSFSIIPFLI